MQWLYEKPVLEWFSELYRINLLVKLQSSSPLRTCLGLMTWARYLPDIFDCLIYNYCDAFHKTKLWFCFSFQLTGHKVGFKPAGGIRSAKDALTWLSLMKEELGDDWTHPNLFRIGASSLLGDIERQLFHHVTGRWVMKSGRNVNSWEMKGRDWFSF